MKNAISFSLLATLAATLPATMTAARTCRNGDVCACEACAKDPIFGRWAADLPGEKFDPAVWFAFSRDGGGRPHVSMLWRWGILQYPETISYAGGVFAFRQPLKGPPASLKGANRYVQRRETHFKWYFCSLVDSDHLKVEMKDLNYWAQPITGTKVDLGSFVCTRIPPPGPEPDLDKAVYGKPVDLLANGLADWEEDQKGNRLPNQWSFKEGVLSTAHKLTPAGGWVAGCNLRTKKGDYGDCKISFDFRLPELSNSGVWLRGNFEINVCDSYGWAIDNRNSGVLCGLFEPLVSAEKKFGEWQHIDCWFVNRHCTIILNGKVTMDNAPVYGVTGGAKNSNVNSLGPIILQGDHSGCDFRNMVLTPILSCPAKRPSGPCTRVSDVVFEDVLDSDASHTGDICFHDGNVYTSVCLYNCENRGRIQVFDGKDLAFVRESPGFPRPADGSLSFYEYKDGSFIERAQQAVPHSRRQGRKPRRGRLHAGVFSHVFGA